MSCADMSSDIEPSGSQRPATLPIRIAKLFASSGSAMSGTASAELAATPPARARAIARRAFAWYAPTATTTAPTSIITRTTNSSVERLTVLSSNVDVRDLHQHEISNRDRGRGIYQNEPPRRGGHHRYHHRTIEIS